MATQPPPPRPPEGTVIPAATLNQIPEAFANPKLERKQTHKRTVQRWVREAMPSGTQKEIERKIRLADSLLSIRFSFQYRAPDGWPT
jgi:hypothetical protein